MLITPEEKKRLEEIAAVAAEGDGVKHAEIVWVCDLARQLARLKITEADFPAYAALVNAVDIGIPVGFVEPIPIEQQTCIIGPFNAGPAHLWQIFDHTTETAVCDAALCVRPYIRLVEPKTDEMLDRLAQHGRVRVEIDEHQMIDGGSAEEHLVGFDGYGLRRQPFRFRVPQKPNKGDIFRISELDEKTGQAVGVTDQGVFLPNGVSVKICLSGVELQEGEKLRLSTGLVMGRYSTKVSGLPTGFTALKDSRQP